ncbi:MAG: type VI secretion system ImpA family N-terminal domain-containing protein, partial [Deltaproteobacteria bacterium]|nr:type VI secretion system ImpA family N-terminal domain-containing protein [Deltaproteobacteria bacterium]
MNLDLPKIVEQSTAPLAGDSPAGENARYEPNYDAVKTEVDKLTAMAAGESGIDWEIIAENSAKLLAATTKDLNLAAYLSLALLKLAGYPGLEAGFQVILGLMDKLWEDVFPPKQRMKARANVFDWLDDRVGGLVAVVEPNPDEAEALRHAVALAQELAGKVGSLVDVPVTGFSSLRQALNQQAAKLPAPAAAAPAPAEPAAAAPPAP